MVNKMDQEISATKFELAGELLKGRFDTKEINRILLEVAKNIETGADYLANIIAERNDE